LTRLLLHYCCINGITAELTALIRVHDFRRAVFQDRFFQGFDTRVGRQGVGQTPSLDTTGGPVEYGAQRDKTPLHRNGRRIPGPNLIRAVNRQTAQEVGVSAVRLVAAAGVGLAVEGFNAPLFRIRVPTCLRPI